MDKYQQFEQKFFNEILPNKPDYIRKGQALMNFLAEFDNEEYKRLSSAHYYDRTDIDCFYKDSLVPNTLDHLKSIWS